MSITEFLSSLLPTPTARRTAILAGILTSGVFFLPSWSLAWIPITAAATEDLAKAALALFVLLLGAIGSLIAVVRRYAPQAIDMQKSIAEAKDRLRKSRTYSSDAP